MFVLMLKICTNAVLYGSLILYFLNGIPRVVLTVVDSCTREYTTGNLLVVGHLSKTSHLV